MSNMQRHGGIRRQCCAAERERDIAIDEAAAAHYELGLLREEVATLRREKDAWEAGKDAWSHRHQHLLWHVGNMAEVLWHAMRADDEVTGGSIAPVQNVEEARLLALQTLEQLTVKSDAQLYDEMHDLYAKIAQMEIQHSRLMEQIRELTVLNDKLASTIEINDGLQSKRHRFQPKHNAKEEQQRSVEGVSTRDKESRSRKAPKETEDAAAREDPVYSMDESTAALLQAQLAMYVQFTKRHVIRGHGPPSTGQIE